jgi:dTDP-4-dehydrorhamnose reductase
MRILILGGGGLLGHQVYRTLTGAFETHATLRSYEGRLRELGLFDENRLSLGLDVRDPAAVDAVLSKVRPAWVINCIGIIKQSSAASDVVSCLEVNALLPHRLAAQCAAVGARLIHISTDCVFSGDRGNYSEADVSDATDVYGRTKFLGEVTSHGAVTIRTSIVGTSLVDNSSLFDWFLSRGDTSVKGFTQAIYTGLTSEYLAMEILRIVEQGSLESGLWQIAGEKISKYELLLRLREAFALPTRIAPDYEFKCDRSLRPDKYVSATGFAPPAWDAMIEAFARDRAATYGWKNT